MCSCFQGISPPDRKGLLDFMLESAFAMLLHHAPTQYPPEQLASGSCRVSRQSCLPVDPAQYPARAARQWIPPSIPPERLASGSRRVSRQSGSPVDPAEYPARAAREWIPPSIPPEQLASSISPELLASGSRQVSCQSGYPTRAARQSSPLVDSAKYPAEYASGSRQASHQSSPPVDPAEYPAEYPLPVDPEPERLASIRQWMTPVSRQSSSPVWFCLMPRPARSWFYISCWCLRVLSVP